MDYLTWLMALQETDRRESLPEFFVKTGLFPQGIDTASVSMAAAELAAQWESTALAAKAMQEQASAEAGLPSTESAAPAARGGSQRLVYGEIFHQVGGETDMEAISRFFERDARRYG